MLQGIETHRITQTKEVTKYLKDRSRRCGITILNVCSSWQSRTGDADGLEEAIQYTQNTQRVENEAVIVQSAHKAAIWYGLTTVQ